jgi:acyl dehydratase
MLDDSAPQASPELLDDSAPQASPELTSTPRAFQAGETLPDLIYRVTRADLVRYAGASGDFNPIHWSDRVATSVGLPGVIAHGMYTMALAGRAITTWTGDPGAVVEYGVRFTKPVVVPDDETGTEVVVSGTVKSVADGVAQIDLTVTCGGEKVLAQAKAHVRSAEPDRLPP